MKILLDEMYTRYKIILKPMGYDVLTVEDIGLKGQGDDKIVDYAKANDRIIVTQNPHIEWSAKPIHVEYVLVSPNDIALIMDQKLKALKK